MLPSIIRTKINRLRQWECSLRFFWGLGRLVAVVLVVLVLACVTDYIIDRYQDTPWGLRLGLSVVQVAIAAFLLVSIVMLPLFYGVSDDKLALQVEEKYPELQHRLISVIQFHRSREKTRGMSQELIEEVTKEAEHQTRGLNFSSVADGRRLPWSFATAIPAVALLVGLFAWDSETWGILLGRQVMLDWEIPRLVQVDQSNELYWPQGENVKLRFRVTGKWNPEMTGLVVISPENQKSKAFDLAFEKSDEAGDGIFVAEIPGEYDDFEYNAWINDPNSWFAAGRTREPGNVEFKPRPVVSPLEAWIVLPPEFGLRFSPDGKPLPYEERQRYGKLMLIERAKAKVVGHTQTPIQKATLQILGPQPVLGTPRPLTRVLGLAPSIGPAGPWTLIPYVAVRGYQARKNMIETPSLEEIILAELDMKITNGKDTNGNDIGRAEVTFHPPVTATGYRVKVVDEYGFENIPLPRRSISFVKEDPLTVALLPPQFPPIFGTMELPPSFYRVDGLPVPEGKGNDIRISYSYKAPFGAQSAILFYRIIRPTPDPESGSERFLEGAWYPYKLPEFDFKDQDKLIEKLWAEKRAELKASISAKLEKQWSKLRGKKLNAEDSRTLNALRILKLKLMEFGIIDVGEAEQQRLEQQLKKLGRTELSSLARKLRELTPFELEKLEHQLQGADSDERKAIEQKLQEFNPLGLTPSELERLRYLENPALKFDSTLGTFREVEDRKINVPFYRDRSAGSGGRYGGGRIHLELGTLPVEKEFALTDKDGKKRTTSLRKGDQLEYYVKVFAGKVVLENGEYVSEFGRPWAQSEPQVTRVVSGEEFSAWLDRVLQEGARIQALKSQQQGVFPDG